MAGGGFQLRGADANFNSRCVSAFQSFGNTIDPVLIEQKSDDARFKIPDVPPVQSTTSKRKTVNTTFDCRDQKAPYKKYIKYSLASVDATGQFGNVGGDRLNSAVAFDFLEELKRRKSEKLIEPMACDSGSMNDNSSKRFAKHDNCKVIMPEYSFGRKVDKKKAIRKVSDGEFSADTVNIKDSNHRTVQLSHLAEEDEEF